MFLIITGAVCTLTSGCWQSSLKRADNGVTFPLTANGNSGYFLSDNFFLQLPVEDTAVSDAPVWTPYGGSPIKGQVAQFNFYKTGLLLENFLNFFFLKQKPFRSKWMQLHPQLFSVQRCFPIVQFSICHI